MNNEVFSTQEAFERLLDRPDLWRKTGRPMQQRFSLKNKLRNGINVTIDTKEKILAEAGYTVKQETIWRFPDPIPTKKHLLAKVKMQDN
jgi:hypothetical protein